MFQWFQPFHRRAPFHPPPSSSPATRGRKEVGVQRLERLELLEPNQRSEPCPSTNSATTNRSSPLQPTSAPEATLIGKVILGENASIWFGVVIRGDNDSITIGNGSNVQDNAVLHADPGFPLTVGDNVTIGHQAMLHGCTIGDGSLIGIQAVVMNSAVIGKDCLVGAGALVAEGKTYGERKLIVGSPAKVIRELTDEDIEKMHRAAAGYVKRKEIYKLKLNTIG